MDLPKHILRPHDLVYYPLDLGSIKIPGEKITAFYKVVESYSDRGLHHWFVNQDGARYRACREGCGSYSKRETTSSIWLCSDCDNKLNLEEISKKAKEAYKACFNKRLLEAVKAARKALPKSNIRKGRKSDSIVYDIVSSMDVELINSVINQFNLKLGHVKPMYHPNARYSRRYGGVIDINPMRFLEKILNGEKSE